MFLLDVVSVLVLSGTRGLAYVALVAILLVVFASGPEGDAYNGEEEHCYPDQGVCYFDHGFPQLLRSLRKTISSGCVGARLNDRR